MNCVSDLDLWPSDLRICQDIEFIIGNKHNKFEKDSPQGVVHFRGKVKIWGQTDRWTNGQTVSDYKYGGQPLVADYGLFSLMDADWTYT